MPGLSGAGRAGRVLYNTCAEETTLPRATRHLESHLRTTLPALHLLSRPKEWKQTEQQVLQGATHEVSASSSHSQVCWYVRASTSYTCIFSGCDGYAVFLEGSWFTSRQFPVHAYSLPWDAPENITAHHPNCQRWGVVQRKTWAWAHVLPSIQCFWVAGFFPFVWNSTHRLQPVEETTCMELIH